MLNLNDLKFFYSLLTNEKCEISKKLKILKKLDDWTPIKEYIVKSNIGRVLYKYSKFPDELGSKALIIVKKWKTIFVPYSNNQSLEKNKCKLKQSNSLQTKSISSDQIKLKNISRKSDMKEVPPKKVHLSLKDYYKRKGIERVIENVPDDQCDDNTEITSNVGISFMDSFTIKPSLTPKVRKSAKVLKISEICALTTADSIAKRNDIVKVPSSLICVDPIEINETGRFESQLKVWVPKVTRSNYSNKSQPESLLKLCQDVLVTNRLYIEEVYWTPRELLATVLESYTPEQLLRFEHFNPHFIEEDDDLWQKHFLAKFPRNSPGNASWRRAYKHAVKSHATKIETSVKNLKLKLEAIHKKDQQSSIKVIKASYRNPEKRHFFHSFQEQSCYSRPTQKLRQQLKKHFSHLPF